MASSPLSVSLTSVLSGINAATAEAGVAIIGGLIAALALVLIAAVWRSALLSFRGSRALGTVTRTEPAGPRMCRAHICFAAGDGREVNATLNMPLRTRAGDRLEIRYDPARPESPTDRSALATVTRLLPLAVLAAVGLAGVAGTLYTSARGGFDAFSNGYAVALFSVIAVVAFFVSYVRYGERRVLGRPGPTAAVPRGSGAGAVLVPILVGAIMLAFAVIFAVGT